MAHRLAAIAYSLISAAYTGCWLWRHVLSPLMAGAYPVGVLHYSSSDPLGYLIFIFVITPLVLLAFAGSLTLLLFGTVLFKRLSRSLYGAMCAWLGCFQGVLSALSLSGCLSFELGPQGNPLVVAWWIVSIIASVAFAAFSMISVVREEGASCGE